MSKSSKKIIKSLTPEDWENISYAMYCYVEDLKLSMSSSSPQMEIWSLLYQKVCAITSEELYDSF